MNNHCKLCGNDCPVDQCYYPHGRLENQLQGDVIVPKSYSKIPEQYFELEITNATDLKVLDAHNDTFLDCDALDLFNAAVGGNFHIERGSPSTVVYEAIAKKSFSVIVGVRNAGYWQCVLRLFTGINQIFCSQFKQPHYLGSGRLPPPLKMVSHRIGSMFDVPTSQNQCQIVEQTFWID